MKKSGFDRKLSITAACVLALLMAFALGFYSAETRNALYYGIKGIFSDVEHGLAEAPNLVKPVHFLQPARFPGSGVIINETRNDDWILMAGFFDDGNEIRLIRRDGEIIQRWPVKFSELFKDDEHMLAPPQTDWNIDIHGALALPDGSVLFNFEYGGMVRLDRCGEVMWTLAHPTHHHITRAREGGFWVPGRRYHDAGSTSEFPPFSTPFSEDLILRVSDEGEVLEEFSVPGLFYASGLEALLTSSGETIHPRDKWDRELVHLNSIDELGEEWAGDFPGFEPGDLLLSLREFNMLLVANPVSRQIKWWQIGPWARQHHAQFLPGGKILLFNNNTYRAAYGSNNLGVTPLDAAPVSGIMTYDFETAVTETLYGQRPRQDLLSIERGKVQMNARGELLITEFGAGRVLETDSSGVVTWAYINRYDNNLVAEITDASRYKSDYFISQPGDCP